MKNNRSEQAVKPTEDLDWVSREFGGADLGDARRDARLVGLARALAERPEVSLPQALEDRAALKAAYRFFDNEDVNARDILAPHIASSVERMRGQPVILAVQDTTYIDYSGHRATEGLGPMNDKDGWGLLCHGTLAFTPEGLPLGVLGLRVWARDPKNRRLNATRPGRAIEDKESYKWLDSVQALARLREQLPGTRLVSVADREADVYEFFNEAQALGVDLLVRASWDRRVESPQGHVWSTLAKAPLLTQQRLQLPRRSSQAARVAKLSLRACPITLQPPVDHTSTNLEPIGLWALWACEMRPPAGVKAIEWMLLSTIPIDSAEQACERLQWYARRWGIEIWHRILKGGCKIEARQLESFDRLQRLLSVYAVIAWRILYARMLARLAPDVSASAILAPDEWQALYCRIHRTRTPPATAPPLRQALRWIARLGGFLGRTGDGEPGVQTIWNGFHELIALTDMYRIMNPDKSRKSKHSKIVGND
jgi:Transposase DNA-binding/Transposase Tn5 dimerisation domain